MTARYWRLGGVAAAALMLVAAWFLLVSPTLEQAAALDVETASQQAANQQLRARISLLKKQSEELPAQEAKLASIQQRMPATPALPTLIRNLTSVAQDANVTVSSVTPGRPTAIEQPMTGAPAPQSTASDPSAESSEATSGSSSSSTSRAAQMAAAGPKAQNVDLAITACGTFAQLRNYLRELETLKRVAMVSGLSISHGSCGEGSPESDLTASITAHVFTLPNLTAVGTTTSSGSTGSSDTEGSGDE